MAYIDVNTRVLDNVKSDDIVSVLNSIIDEELAKDVSQMNTELVDECVNALLELEQEKDNTFRVLIPIIAPEAFIKKIQPEKSGWKSLNVFARAGIVAAVLASTTFTANAAYQSATGVNVLGDLGDAIHTKLQEIGVIKSDDDEVVEITNAPKAQTKKETTTEETTEEVTSLTEVRAHAPVTAKPAIEQFNGDDDEEDTTKSGIDQFNGVDDDDDETTTETTSETTTRRKPTPTTEKPITAPTSGKSDEAVLVSLSADYDDSFKVDYIYGEKLSYDGLTLSANYSDGTSREVKLSECNYTKSIDMTATGDHTLRIIYQNCVITIDITVRPDEDTRGAEICTSDLYEYMLTKNGAYITKYKGDEKNIDLDILDGNPVFAIASGVFSGKNIETVTAENCTKIFEGAFKDCKNLETCYTPRATYIGASAFENDVKFKVPVFSDNLSYIGTAVYKNSGITELQLTENVSEVPDELCEKCADLTYVDLRGAEAVGKNAFSECTSLKEVSGTDGLTKADDFAFYNCSEAEFNEKPSKLTSAGNSAFAYCSSIDFGELYITEVDKYAFAYCHKLTSTEISGKVKIIPEGAFRGTHLETLTLNEGTQEIDDMAFMSTSITEVTLPSSLTRIGTYGLYSIKLREVHCSRNLSTIETSAFFRSRLTLYVYNNSYAHNYAIENGIKFEIIKESDSVIQLSGEDD